MSNRTKTKDETKWDLYSKVLISDVDCWEWQASRLKHGYGQYKRFGLRLAHRVSYFIHYGDIPEGMVIMHTCDNPSCVNPSHLRLGTHKDNAADMHNKGRERSFNRDKTHCKRGHVFDSSNTFIDHRGMRQCRLCIPIRAQLRKLK